jgi:hypothetical protein
VFLETCRLEFSPSQKRWFLKRGGKLIHIDYVPTPPFLHPLLVNEGTPKSYSSLLHSNHTKHAPHHTKHSGTIGKKAEKEKFF